MDHPDRRAEVPDATSFLVFTSSCSRAARSQGRLRYRLDGKPRKFTIGTYPRHELAQAREEARAALRLAAKGADPAAERENQRRDEAETRANTFEAIARDFIERSAKEHQPRSWRATLTVFERDLFPEWRTRPFASIRRRDLHAILDVMQTEGRSGSKHCRFTPYARAAAQDGTRDPRRGWQALILPAVAAIEPDQASSGMVGLPPLGDARWPPLFILVAAG